MTLHITLSSGHVAVLGRFLPVTRTDLRYFVRMYDKVWIYA